MADAWRFLGSTPLQRLGRLTLREDAWRLPTGSERRYPVLHVGMCVGIVAEDLTHDPLASDDDEFFERRVVPFGDAVAMALDDRITGSASKVALLAAALTSGRRP